MKHPMSDILKLFFLVLLGAALLSCSTIQLRNSVKSTDRVKGVYHRVKQGESLWRISKAYHVDLQELAEVNNITDASRIGAGSVLFIPDAREVIDIPPVKPPAAPRAATPKRQETVDTAAREPEERQTSGAVTGAGTVAGRSRVNEESITDRVSTPKTGGVPAAQKTPERPSAVSAGPSDKSPAAAAKTPTPAKPPPTPVPVKSSDETSDVKTGTVAAPKKPEPAPKSVPVKSDETADVKVGAAAAPKKPEPAPKPEEGTGQIRVEKGRFLWPVKGTVITSFGIQPSGMKYNGIKIAAREGLPVHASAAGTIIYASYVKGYGDTIIVKHDENYSTVYAYLKNGAAKKDDRVKKGEKIAVVGPSVEPGGEPFLYFEIREKNRARNPMFFLP